MRGKMLFVAVAVLFVVAATGEKPDENLPKVSNLREARYSDKVSHYEVLDKASVPQQINYQGYLTDDADNAIIDTLEMTFSIWDAASGGNQLWSETQPEVHVIDGLFNVLLGSATSIPSSVFSNPICWLQTQIASQILSPRKELVSVGYAFRADTADFATVASTDNDWTIDGDDIYHETGNVGIGTTGPTRKLDVRDTDGIAIYGENNDDFYATVYVRNYGNGPSARFQDGDVIISNGNLGIGTTSPSAKLDVSGDVNTSSLYRIGGNTAISVSGTQNILVGVDAGANNTGNCGTFVGYNAGYNNQGNFNTFLGRFAGYSNTTGDDNTFVGKSAGYSNTTGDANTFLGLYAGYSNTTGAGNVFVGYQAGYNETGSNKLYIANGPNDSDVLIYGDFSTGDIGIGTTTPTTKLHVVGAENNGTTATLKITSGSQNMLLDGNEIDALTAGLYLNNNSAEKVILATGGGNVGIGDPNPTYRLELPDIASEAGRGRANQWVIYSSREEKRNIARLGAEDYAAVLKEISEMDLVYYRYKNQEDGRRYLGVVAEDAPEQVVTSDRKGLSLSEFVAFAIAGLKAQQAEIEKLKREIQVLKEGR